MSEIKLLSKYKLFLFFKLGLQFTTYMFIALNITDYKNINIYKQQGYRVGGATIEFKNVSAHPKEQLISECDLHSI